MQHAWYSPSISAPKELEPMRIAACAQVVAGWLDACDIDFSALSTQALDDAVTLVGKLQAHMTLLHIIQIPILAGEPAMGSGVAYADLLAQLKADASRTLVAYVERVRKVGLECDTVVMHGTPFQQIIDIASVRQVDMIVMATRGHTGLLRFLLGEVPTDFSERVAL